MFARHRLRSSPILRLLVLALLVSGALAKPLLAVACELGDARQALVAQQAAQPAGEAGASGDCCPAQDCTECCVPATALVPGLGVATGSSVNAGLLPTLSVQFEPRAYPVGFRPPIAG